MEKIFKKSLALVLSAALCLTALVGCLTVSAADETTPAYAISTDAKGKVGDTVEVIAEYTDISTVCGHYVTVTFPANFTVNEVYQAKESADGEVYKLLTAYKEDSQDNWQYKMDVVEGKTAIKSCDIINFFASEGSEHNVTTGSLKFKFVVTIGEVEVGEYPVNIAVEAASQEEKWITPALTNGKITVEANTPAHEHKWDAGVMTTMPTTTSNGVITYTCSDCEETRTEDFVVEATRNIETVASYTKVGVSDFSVQYAARIDKTVFSGIGNAGGTVVERGMLFTKDGATPEIDVKNVSDMASCKKAATNTSGTASYYGGYTGMNLTQMGWTLKFRAYVKFTYNGADCYYYGPVYEKVFIDSIRSNTDDQSKAIVGLYDNKATATNISEKCNGNVVADKTSGYNISTLASYTKLDMTNFGVQYATKIDKTVFSGIGDAGGTVIERGMLFTKDGSIPEIDGANVSDMASCKKAATNTSGTASYYGGYTGMNLMQAGFKLTFRPYVKYNDSEGNACYVYGDAVQFSYIDILRNYVDTNDYAKSIVEYYDAYIANK